MTTAAKLLAWTARVFGDDVATRVFEPLLADWQCEVSGVQSARGRALAWVRGCAALLRCVIAVGMDRAVPHALDWCRFARSGTVALAFLLLGTFVLLVPFLPWWLNRGWTFGRLLIDLLPTTLGFAWPFALVPASLRLSSELRDARASWRARVAVTLAAVMTTAALAAVHGLVAPLAARDLQQRLRSALPTAPDAVNPPALRITALGAMSGRRPPSPNEARRRAATTLIWPAALLFLGWRVGRHRASSSVVALTTWWLLPAWIALGFQPAATPFGSLHPMQFMQTPEFSAAAVWFAIGLALRPRTLASRPVTAA